MRWWASLECSLLCARCAVCLVTHSTCCHSYSLSFPTSSIHHLIALEHINDCGFRLKLWKFVCSSPYNTRPCIFLWGQVPLTAVLLLFELTHDYFIIIPTLASVGISYWVASFPIASLLQPLSPVFRQWLSDAGSPLSSSVQARTAMSEEVSAAVSEALSGEASLGNSGSPLLGIAAPQPGSTEATPREKGGVMEVTARPLPHARASGDPAGHSGRISSLGRGGGAAVSFSGSSLRPSMTATNGRVQGKVADSSSSSSGGGAAVGERGEELGLVGSLQVLPKDKQVEDLTVLCALRQACVMLTPDTSLSEALQVHFLQSLDDHALLSASPLRIVAVLLLLSSDGHA